MIYCVMMTQLKVGI